MSQHELIQSKQNILFIIHRLPYPLSSGGKQALFNGIMAVKDHYNIFITYPEDSGKDTKTNQDQFNKLLGGNITILPYPTDKEKTAPKPKNLLQRLVGKINTSINGAPSIKPKNPFSYWIEELLPKSPQSINHILGIIEEHHIDIVQCEMLCNLSFVHVLPPRVKTIFVHHELGFVRHELELQNRKSDLFDGQSFAMCSKSLEIGQLNRYDCVVTLSPIDKQKLIESGVTTKIEESFAVVNAKENPSLLSDWKYELTFVGPDNHEPNLVGLNWFLENCWEKLLQLDSRYQLTIIGKWTERNITKLSAKYKNLRFAGFVDDLEDALHNTVMIVPITVGSGIRMKILEAANIGIPFISTSVGAEGIPVSSGTHCLIADTSEDFILAIERMKDNTLRDSFIHQANLMVRKHYSIDALRQNRLSIYQSLYEKE